MTHQTWIRIALGYLALNCLQLGVWALLAPASFFNDFPGFGGMAWLTVDGPYNEHLVRDFGALNLALMVVLIGAAVSLSRPLVLTACAAAVAWGLPHFTYHVLNPDGLSSSDLAVSLSGLALFAGLPLIVAWFARPASGLLTPKPA